MIRPAVVVPIVALAAFVGLGGAGATRGRFAGFAPESLAAVGSQDVWLLGTVPCRGGRCVAVLRSADGGRRFARVAAPPAEGTLRFADRRDGFVEGSSSLWSTHDGGASWRLALRQVLAFTTGGGSAYAVTGRCGQNGSCTGVRFERSPVTADAWSSTPMPFAHAVPNFDLAAVGTSVWLFGGASSGGRLRNVLARSADRGSTFGIGTAPCYADLAAELQPVSPRVLWAFCPTGMMGIAWRSTDGGKRFRPLSIPRCCANSTALAPASDATAVVSRADLGLLRTTNGGMTWRPTGVPRGIAYWSSIQFADARVGLGLAQIGTGPVLTLLRTTDAGANWHAVSIR